MYIGVGFAKGVLQSRRAMVDFMLGFVGDYIDWFVNAGWFYVDFVNEYKIGFGCE